LGSGVPAPGKDELPLATPDKIAALVSGPDMLTSDEMAEQLDVSRETIHQWHKAGKIIGVNGAKRGLRFPKWQIGDRGRPLAGLEEIVGAFHDDHWAAWRFLSEPVPELGQLGYEALAQGKEKSLLRVLLARSHGSFT
jgi:hypothetical protein